MITCEELIALLKKYPSDMRVLVSGYEMGYNEPMVVSKAVKIADWESDYCGMYHDAEIPSEVLFDAVVIARGGR